MERFEKGPSRSHRGLSFSGTLANFICLAVPRDFLNLRGIQPLCREIGRFEKSDPVGGKFRIISID